MLCKICGMAVPMMYCQQHKTYRSNYLSICIYCMIKAEEQKNESFTNS